MRPRLRTLLDQKEIRRSKSTIEIVARQLDSAASDLETARLTLKTGDNKWATIQAYHSMLHASRALLYRMGYREQSPHGLLAALNELYEREVVNEMLENLSTAVTLTERLLDGKTISQDSARKVIENGIDFLEQSARILAAPREWFERPFPRRRRLETRKR